MHVLLVIGHSKHSKGAKNSRHKNRLNEYDLNSKIAPLLRSSIIAAGHKCTIITGNSVRQKVSKVNTYNADIMVSLHLNAFKGYNKDAHGCEVLIQKGDLSSGILASVLLEKFSNVISTNRGVKQRTKRKRGGLILCATNATIRVLAEPLFIDGTEGLMMLDADFTDNIAMLYAEGILEYIERMC